jgi:DNA-binding CsgD family transcriptional regulator
MPNLSPSADEQAEMVCLYREQRLSMAEIGDRMSWSATAVRNALKRNGVAIRPRSSGAWRRQLATPEVERTLALYRSGGPNGGPLSMAEVARVLGLATSTIWFRLRHIAGEMPHPPHRGLRPRDPEQPRRAAIARWQKNRAES